MLLLWLALLLPTLTHAQKMTVESMMLAPNDVTANLEENLHQDLNGDFGGLVKVMIATHRASFDGLVLEQKLHMPSEYWVFMAKGSKHLTVYASGLLPLDINFRDYGIECVEPRRTYVLTILLPQVVSSEQDDATNSSKEVFTVNGVSFTMVRVEGGTFTMGATNEQGSDAYDEEKPAHEVTLSTFSIGETEVTQALWQAVMGSNPSKYNDNPQNPVERVSWDDCQEFVKKLSSLTGKTFRIPTEAEWEYAARGGSKSRHYKYSGGNFCSEVAWMWENSGDKPLSGNWDGNKITSNHCKAHPVKEKFPNELGLYDMSGNVSEWCEDWYDKYYYKASPLSNPQGPLTGSNRIFRGGNWYEDAWNCRVSRRYYYTPNSRFSLLGLRLAL